MVVYFDLLFHIGRGGAFSVHWVAAKCSIFDQNLLQIAISQEGKVYYQDTAKKGQFQGLSSLFLLENLQNTKQQ